MHNQLHYIVCLNMKEYAIKHGSQTGLGTNKRWKIMKTDKIDVDGGQLQANLLDTIRDLKNEMQANAALPAVPRRKDGKNGGRAANY